MTQTAHNAVPNYGITHSLGNDESRDGRNVYCAVHQMNDERPATGPHAEPNCGREVVRVAQSTGLGQHPPGSGRQFGAALATPGSEDGPACTGPHAQPKTVGLGPATIVRLEGSLAHNGSTRVEHLVGITRNRSELQGRRPFSPVHTPIRDNQGGHHATERQHTTVRVEPTVGQTRRPPRAACCPAIDVHTWD